jgi:ribonuclease HI
MVAAWRIHWETTSKPPLAEGAALVGATGINRAEYHACIQGLNVLADMMWFGECSRKAVHVVTDSAYVVNQATRQWAADALHWHLDRLDNVCETLAEMTNGPVWFIHASSGETAATDTLVRAFPALCDSRHRDQWELIRLRARWQAVLANLTENNQLILAAVLERARPTSYNGKTLVLGFKSQVARAKTEERVAELKHAIQQVTGKAPQSVRCVAD